MKKPTPAQKRLDDNRRQAEQRLDAVRRALRSEIGWAPRGRGWALPLVAFGCGVALAYVLRRRKQLTQVETPSAKS